MPSTDHSDDRPKRHLIGWVILALVALGLFSVFTSHTSTSTSGGSNALTEAVANQNDSPERAWAAAHADKFSKILDTVQTDLTRMGNGEVRAGCQALPDDIASMSTLNTGAPSQWTDLQNQLNDASIACLRGDFTMTAGFIGMANDSAVELTKLINGDPS